MKKNIISICVLIGVFAWIGYSVLSRSSCEDVYPSKYIDIICPFSAGGGTDLLCRTIADSMSKEFRVPVNVQNITGGGGALGHTQGASVKADGYTLTMITFELITLSQRGFIPISPDDFDYVARLNADASCIAVNADSSVNTLADFVKKSREGIKFKVGNSGVGSVWHLAAEIFAKSAGIEMNLVAFDGASNAVTAMLGGHIDAVSVSAAELKSHVESGRVKILAVMSDKRISDFKDVPTCRECGIDAEFFTWRGIAVPKGVKDETKKLIANTLKQILNTKKMHEFSKSTGINIEYLDGDSFKREIIEQFAQIEPLMKELGLVGKKR